jgi:hypothetical protein
LKKEINQINLNDLFRLNFYRISIKIWVLNWALIADINSKVGLRKKQQCGNNIKGQCRPLTMSRRMDFSAYEEQPRPSPRPSIDD